jgi:hypothetical protein
MSDKHSIAQISLKEDEELIIQKKNNKVKPPNHYRVGNGTMNRDKIKARDFIQELIELSNPARTVIGWIKDGMTYDPYEDKVDFVVRVIPDTDAGKQVLKKGFKELKEKDLVRRVKRGYYMIDPHALTTDYEAQMEVWESLE